MTALQVIEEIEKLPNEERVKVIEFARRAVRKKALSPVEIGNLCEQMQNTKDSKEADRLERKIISGFYGEE